MKNKITTLVAGGTLFFAGLTAASAQSTAEASDRAFEMGMKYAAQGFYLAPSHEGKAGFATTMEFLVPVQRGLDYVFILAGDKFCLDVDVWVEDGGQGGSGNTIVRDSRKVDNGLCGVRWRSQFNGSVLVVVHFARVTSRCGWAALVGRRGTLNNPYQQTITTSPGGSGGPAGGGTPSPNGTPAIRENN